MCKNEFDGKDGNGYQPLREGKSMSGRSPKPLGAERPEPPPPPPPPERSVKGDTPLPPTRDHSSVHLLQFDPSAIEGAAAYLERNLEAMTRYQLAYARLQRERFVSLAAVGFTEEQALEIICRTAMFGN